MTNPTLFNQLLIWPIINILIGIYKGLLFMRIPGAFGMAVILLTVAIRLILHPLTKSQLQSAQKMAKLKPQMDKLNETYKNDKTRLQQEQLRLYKEAGINPAAGCLPLLLQMPVLIALYNVFWQVLGAGSLVKIVGQINQILYFPFLKIVSLDLNFFGLNLASKPSDWQKTGWWLLLVPLITALLQYWQTKTLTGQSPKSPPKSVLPEGSKKEDDMATVMQNQMSFMMPLMIGFFAYSFPIGLALYWNTFSVFGIIQQYLITKENKNKS